MLIGDDLEKIMCCYALVFRFRPFSKIFFCVKGATSVLVIALEKLHGCDAIGGSFETPSALVWTSAAVNRARCLPPVRHRRDC